MVNFSDSAYSLSKMLTQLNVQVKIADSAETDLFWNNLFILGSPLCMGILCVGGVPPTRPWYYGLPQHQSLSKGMVFLLLVFLLSTQLTSTLDLLLVFLLSTQTPW